MALVSFSNLGQQESAYVGSSGFFDHHTEKLLDDLKSGNRKRKRQTKWGAETAKMFIPGVPPILLADLDGKKLSALMTRIRIDEITMRLNCLPVKPDETECRSPSPPPCYNGMGQRSNTREFRIKEKLARERQMLVQEAKKINPSFRPPPDFKPISLRKSKKIYIPIKEYPEYNFMGLIIGPRGMTQKQMERETGTKISIRGKGSEKAGKGKKAGVPEDEDELHVLITGETNEQIKRATILIEKLLIPVEEGQNEHKRNQLRELAKINGTLRENFWEHEKTMGFSGPQVACAHCGELSHPSADCPFKNQPGFVNRNIDKEYDAFLAAIGDDDAGKPGAPSAGGPPGAPGGGLPFGAPGAGGAPGMTDEEKQKEYEAFMASINEDAGGAGGGRGAVGGGGGRGGGGGGGAPWMGPGGMGPGGFGMPPMPPGGPWMGGPMGPPRGGLMGPGPGMPPPMMMRGGMRGGPGMFMPPPGGPMGMRPPFPPPPGGAPPPPPPSGAPPAGAPPPGAPGAPGTGRGASPYGPPPTGASPYGPPRGGPAAFAARGGGGRA